jgi:hypothetical protein
MLKKERTAEEALSIIEKERLQVANYSIAFESLHCFSSLIGLSRPSSAADRRWKQTQKMRRKSGRLPRFTVFCHHFICKT